MPSRGSSGPLSLSRYGWYTNWAGTGTCPYDCTFNLNIYIPDAHQDTHIYLMNTIQTAIIQTEAAAKPNATRRLSLLHAPTSPLRCLGSRSQRSPPSMA